MFLNLKKCCRRFENDRQKIDNFLCPSTIPENNQFFAYHSDKKLIIFSSNILQMALQEENDKQKIVSMYLKGAPTKCIVKTLTR